MRRPLLPPLAAAVLLLLATGCADQQADLVDAQDRWERRRPSAHAYTYVAGASTRFEARVTVRGDAIDVRVVEGGELQGPDEDLRVEAVFRDTAEALRDADDVEVEYDEQLGYPRLLQVDQDASAVDDEHGIRIEDFVVLR